MLKLKIISRACLVFLLFMSSINVYSQTFNFTAIPDQDETRLQQRFDKIADYLSQELQINVKYIPVKSYAAAITAFRNNQVQLAWFGALSGIQARKRVPNSEAIAQGFEDQFFKTYFIAHKSTGLKYSSSFPENIKNKRFSFGSKGSTSGRLMPEYYIRQNLAAPKDAFTKVGFSGDHSRTIALVMAGSYDVGAVNYKVWEKMLKENRINTDLVSVIWQTPTYPDYQWSIRGDVNNVFGEGMKEKVTTALLNMSDSELLNSFPRKAFIAAQNSDYQQVFDTAQAIGIMD